MKQYVVVVGRRAVQDGADESRLKFFETLHDIERYLALCLQ